MARTTVADVLADGLTRAGAGRIFAAPAAGPVAAALRDAAERRGLGVVAAPDAAAAGVLAAVTGEVSDGPGAMIAGFGDTRGLVRGLAHAHRDRAPLIAITEAGPDATLLAPVVKSSLVVEPASAGHWIAHAVNLALAAPRGPVHLIVQAAVVGDAALPVATPCRPAPLAPPDPASLDALGQALAGATRPLVITGLECGLDDAKWLRAFIEALPAPVLATPKGKGTLADPHPLALGPLRADHPLLRRADLVLLVGVDASELPPGVVPATTPVARIGRSAWPGGGVAAALGDIALVIEEMAPRVRARPAADWDVAELDRVKRAVVRELDSTPGGRVVALAREATPAGTIATGDVPALAGWQAVAPHETLSALGQATPGYAVTAAVAAQLAHPDRRVVAFTNADGLAGAQPTLVSAVARGLPILIVTFGAAARRIEAAELVAVETTGASFAGDFSRAVAAVRPTLISVGAL